MKSSSIFTSHTVILYCTVLCCKLSQQMSPPLNSDHTPSTKSISSSKGPPTNRTRIESLECTTHTSTLLPFTLPLHERNLAACRHHKGELISSMMRQLSFQSMGAIPMQQAILRGVCRQLIFYHLKAIFTSHDVPTNPRTRI